jgi:transcriptional antiterminator RfaH
MNQTTTEEQTAWFCLLSRRKHEYAAAAQLAERLAIKVFAPRIRFRLPTRNGARWATEALFPGYFFAKFGRSQVRRVRHAPQVRGIVHFGNSWPIVPDDTIQELERWVGGGEIRVIAPAIASGDDVRIIEGTLHGFEAVVKEVMPARERVTILVDFLGRQTSVEINSGAILRNAEQRTLLFKAA